LAQAVWHSPRNGPRAAFAGGLDDVRSDFRHRRLRYPLREVPVEAAAIFEQIRRMGTHFAAILVSRWNRDAW
jgi:hypothetical protein